MAIQVMSMTLSVSALGTITLTLGLILLLLLCMPCFRKKKGFSNFSNSIASLDVEHGEVNSSFTLTTDDQVSSSQPREAVHIEPLPDIASRVSPFSIPLRPKIGGVGRASHDASIRLSAYHPFPRNQIVYLKELGTGWFGKAIESDAEKIIVGIPRSKVVVKMLKDDASREEKTHFFEEVAPYRMMEHTNVMRILGHCTETSPLLVILEAAAYGNLKQYLCSHRHSEALLIQRNRLIQFSLDLSCGLACLHRHEYLHRDLAARNCLVMSDFTLKIGDYGIADQLYKEDYITCGADLLPLRWMAPETLKQENGYWALHSFSKDSDIWALGVVLWEIATLGEQPYAGLSDEEVLDQVVTKRQLQLPEPHLHVPYKDRLYDLMRCCWADSSQRIELEQVHGLLQAMACMTDEATSGDTTASQFDAKWAQLIPNQHHWSADSIDGHLASTVRGDAGCISELSLSDSLEDLSGQELGQENALHTKAIVHSSAVAGSLNAQMDVESRVGPASFPVLEKDASPISVPSVAADTVSATFPSKSSEIPTNHTSSKPIPDRNETEVFAAGVGLTMNGQVLSGSENSSSGFDVLESTTDFDLVDGKSVSDSIGTCQSSLTGDASIDKDSSSCEFVVISEFKESTVSPSSTDPSVLNGSLSPGEKFALTDSLHYTTSHNDKTSGMVETFKPQEEDTDTLRCLGTELSSKSSLVVQAHSIDSSGEHPSVCAGTGLSSSDSFTAPNPELHNASKTTEKRSAQAPHTSESSDSVCTYLNDGSDFQFEGTLGLCLGSDSLTTVTSMHDSVSSENLTTVANRLGSASFDSLTTVTSLIHPSGSDSLTTVTSLIGPRGSDSCTTVTNLHGSLGSGSLTTVTSMLASSPENTTVEESDAGELLSSEPSFEKIDGSDSEETTHIPQSTTTVRIDSKCLGATGGSSTDAESPTDSDTSTNSESGRDYICQESWEEEGEDSPPPASPSSMDSEEYALMIASEIYLSKGLKNSRPFESTYLEPIPEDPIPSVSEESVAPVPSESSSVDVKFDEVFEWDDFMGDPLVEAAHSPEAESSPKESFDMSEWMLDMESDDMPGSVSSLAAQHPDHLHKHTSAASDVKSTAVAAGSIANRPSMTSDNEAASHGSRARTHRSYISDLLSNRTKGSTSSNSHALRASSNFYSLYEEEFDLESDSQSEGGNSPPGSGGFQSDSYFAQKGAGNSSSYAHLNQSAGDPGADTATSHASSEDGWNDGQGAGSFDDWEDSDEFALD